MKRVNFILLFILFYAINLFSYTINDLSTLNYQITQVQNSFVNKPAALRGLKRYLNSGNSDIKDAMMLALLPKVYKKYEAAEKIRIKIDGIDTEWRNIPLVYHDAAHNVRISNADLIEFRAHLDKYYNLFVMYKTLTRPLKRNRGEAFYIKFYDKNRKSLFRMFFSWNGKTAWYKFYKGDTRKHYIKIKSKVTRVAEAVIPLKRILSKHGASLGNKIEFRAGVYHKRTGRLVKRLKGMRWIMSRIDASHRLKINLYQKNYALELILYLLQKGLYIQGDSITIALALANNYLYSIADNETRQEILKDIEKHFYLYKKIIKWQKTLEIKYDLSKTGIIPKVYWAYRIKHMDWPRYRRKLTLKYYKEFTDTISSLYKMRKILINNNLHKGNSLLHITTKLEKFTRMNLIYRANIDVHRKKAGTNNQNNLRAIQEYNRGIYYKYYFGKKRRWDHFTWLNYQLRLYKAAGKFKGDCCTATLFQMSLYKALGVPCLANQIKSIPQKQYHHHSPLFYNVFFKRWVSIQRPSKKPRIYHNYFVKPRWHHKVRELFGNGYIRIKGVGYSYYSQGEIVKPSQVYALRKGGVTAKYMRYLFTRITAFGKSLVYKNYPFGKSSIDSDNDGIIDSVERALGTNPYKADSDGDGYSDIYEIERNFNPVDKNSKPKEVNAVDGIYNKHEYTHRVDDEKGDYRASSQIYDIKYIAAKLSGDKLYCAAGFHNNVRKNTRKVYSFRINTGYNRYLIQFYNSSGMFRGGVGYCSVYKFSGRRLKRVKKHRYFPIIFVKALEVRIPLKILGKIDKITVWFKSTGIVNGRRTNSDDKSGKIEIRD